MTGGTGFLMCAGWSLTPFPASFVKYGAALRTDARFMNFVFCLIGVMHALLKHAVTAQNLTKAGGSAMRAHDGTPVGMNYTLSNNGKKSVCPALLSPCPAP